MQKEILLVAEAVSGEKGLPQEAIFQAIEQALATATKKRYSENSNIEVTIDPETGDYETYRIWEVVSEEDFEDKGGKHLHVIPCINDSEDWINVLSRWIDEWAHMKK